MWTRASVFRRFTEQTYTEPVPLKIEYSPPNIRRYTDIFYSILAVDWAVTFRTAYFSSKPSVAVKRRSQHSSHLVSSHLYWTGQQIRSGSVRFGSVRFSTDVTSEVKWSERAPRQKLARQSNRWGQGQKILFVWRFPSQGERGIACGVNGLCHQWGPEATLPPKSNLQSNCDQYWVPD